MFVLFIFIGNIQSSFGRVCEWEAHSRSVVGRFVYLISRRRFITGRGELPSLICKHECTRGKGKNKATKSLRRKWHDYGLPRD